MSWSSPRIPPGSSAPESSPGSSSPTRSAGSSRCRRSGPAATDLFSEIMWQFGEFLAIISAALWFASTTYLTRECTTPIPLRLARARRAAAVPVADRVGADRMSDETVVTDAETAPGGPRRPGRPCRDRDHLRPVLRLRAAPGHLEPSWTCPSCTTWRAIPVPWWCSSPWWSSRPCVYVGRVILTRRRRPFAQVLIFAVALGTTYALWLSVVTLGRLDVVGKLTSPSAAVASHADTLARVR